MRDGSLQLRGTARLQYGVRYTMRDTNTTPATVVTVYYYHHVSRFHCTGCMSSKCKHVEHAKRYHNQSAAARRHRSR